MYRALNRSWCSLIAASLIGLFQLGCGQPPSYERRQQALTDQDLIELKFKVYDEDGILLNFNKTRKRMTNGAPASFLSNGNFELNTLRAVKLNTAFNSGGRFTVELSQLASVPRQGVMVHWNTEHTGYSSFLLDNLGQGFSTSQTIVLNERLARDARRHLLEALATKQDYKPSDEFVELKGQIRDCFDALDAVQTDGERGARGQACLDLVATAMKMLLYEYGVFRAQAQADTTAKWGVTIQPDSSMSLAEEKVKIDRLIELFAPEHRWLRILMDGTNTADYGRIADLLEYATSQGVSAMGQLFDSTSQSEISLEQFKELVDEALSYPGFEKFIAWEVGNEVNGGWLGEGMTDKIDFAATRVRERFPNKYICLTFYWYGMQDSLQSSLFNWIDRNVTQRIKDKIDCVTNSIYVDQQPLGFLWDKVQTRIAQLFPTSEVMVGELGFIDPTVVGVFREGRAEWTDEEGAADYIHNRYAAAFATPNAVGGGFWWYFDDEMIEPDSVHWQALRDVYCEANPSRCIAPPP